MAERCYYPNRKIIDDRLLVSEKLINSFTKYKSGRRWKWIYTAWENARKENEIIINPPHVVVDDSTGNKY